MPEVTPKRPHALRALALLVWIALWGLAAFGVFFLGLLIIGMIQFGQLGCGPNRNWGEDIYVACSDIDETNPIFFAIAVPPIAPLLIILLIRFLIRANRASS